jgi:2,3-bisphosphoglycerate-independent phosphoglycerate mutase
VKNVFVIYEGAADVATEELEGSTPLQLARSINAAALVKRGMAGCIHWSGDDHISRTEHALATLLGVTPMDARSLRRGPVEAAGTGVDPSQWTYAYRGNYVPTDGQTVRESRVSGLSLDETKWLTEALTEAMAGENIKLSVVGTGRVSVMFEKLNGEVDPGIFPDVGTPVESGETKSVNNRPLFMARFADVLAAQSINDVRLDLNENPANMLWLWAGGPPVTVTRPFTGAPVKAAMVTNSPLARGLARLCGMKVFDLGDVWSELAQPELIETATLANCMAAHDLTVVYVEAPFEAGSYGTPAEKVKALDRLDIYVLSRVMEAAQRGSETKILLTALPEDGVGMETTPMLLCGSQVMADTVTRWDESVCNEGAMGQLAASRCLSRLFGE